MARGKVEILRSYCKSSVSGQRVAYPAELDTCSSGLSTSLVVWLTVFSCYLVNCILKNVTNST